MKFSYRSTPVLKVLETKSLQSVMISDTFQKAILENAHTQHLSDSQRISSVKDYIESTLREYRADYASSVKCVSLPLVLAMQDSYNKMLDVTTIEEDRLGAETIIFGKHSYLYYWEKYKGGNLINIISFVGDKMVAYYFRCDYLNKELLIIDSLIKERPDQTDSARLAVMINDITVIRNFIRYAPIEPKIILQGGKKLHDQNCKYVNDTLTGITIINSTYITDLHKEGAFKVRGHWRWQACGAAFKERKLIWIADFEKDGYFRKHGRPDEDNKAA